MSERKQAQIDLETRVLNKVLAQLYQSSVASSHPARAEEMGKIDGLFGIERPAAIEMHRFIRARVEAGEDLGSWMRSRIIEELSVLDEDFGKASLGIDAGDAEKVGGGEAARIEALFDAALAEEGAELSDEERQRLLESILFDILAFGPLEPILRDGAVTEVLVDGPGKIYVERQYTDRPGQLEDTPYCFRDDEHLMRFIRRILTPLGRRLDEAHPTVDARLPDGTRVNVVIPPISSIGPVLTLRKLYRRPLTIEDLVRFGAISERIVEFLEACVRSRLNILIAGGTGSGKTTFTNLVLGMIPADERIITVEKMLELRPPEHLKRVVRLESQQPVEGRDEVTLQDLIVNSMRMRPDRIVADEVFGAEVFDLLQAMNTGLEGTIFRIHATGPLDALSRLEMMATFANPSIPLLMIRQMMASAIDIVTYQERMLDGTRKVTRVSEVVGMQGDVVEVQDIFEFRQTGVDEHGRIVGKFVATGYVPTFLDRIRASGIDLSEDFFAAG
jgi:pilus assembly protein CpaF